MKQRSVLWQWAGFATATFGGTILHFLYDWTGRSLLISPFSGVNESTWEHMKLLFWPLFSFALVQRPFFRDHENYWCVKLAGVLFVVFTFAPPQISLFQDPLTGSYGIAG